MTVIHSLKITHKFEHLEKLSTLKHSCFLIDSALKHSCFYAETLLHSIYLYLPILKPIVRSQKIVDMLIKKMMVLFLVISTTACHRTISITEYPTHLGVKETIATPVHPAQFYLCSNDYYLCRNDAHYCLVKNHSIYFKH